MESVMYEVHYRRWFDTPDDYSVVGTAKTIEEAAKLRQVSGDLVVHADTHEIVIDGFQFPWPSLWLFPWEQIDYDCYARRAIRWQEEHK